MTTDAPAITQRRARAALRWPWERYVSVDVSVVGYVMAKLRLLCPYGVTISSTHLDGQIGDKGSHRSRAGFRMVSDLGFPVGNE
ncbi:hypothetical protein GCM10010218_43900 [Streptomyces mashuensis]|uniref:Uncharacterized protein n=1 Tax=Streptomyces mashuensis TaxID=33904 RepID=A0A919B505_9ACTN|nr:hypothetical protein GCM10010218_43900 [Streptomyces mashuensis]